MITVQYPTADGFHLAPVAVSIHTFSGGEEHVNLGSGGFAIDTTEKIILNVQCLDSKTFIAMLLTTDAIRRLYPTNPIALRILYFPYARQDRACVTGDAFSLKVIADIINAQNYSSVYVFDPHSSVTVSLIDRICIVRQDQMVPYVHSRLWHSVDYIVAPDKGATEKAALWAVKWNERNAKKGIGPVNILTGTKIRSAAGSVVATDVIDCPDNSLRKANCLIVDDICDGGRTFTELAKVLKQKGAGSIHLYVSHGIFSQGTKVLFDNYITGVYTTDTFPEKDDGRIVVKRFYY